jgi:sugar phosphate isomerase/epimerase
LGEGKIDVFGYLESCRYRYGLRAADIWNKFLISTEEEYLRKVKDALGERELELADLCVDQAHVWDDDESIREQNYRNALAHLNAARILSARFMRIDAGSRAASWTNEQFDFIVCRYKEYARYAGDHGFKVGAENHWGPEKRWSNLKMLIEAVDHPAFGISCHIGGWEGDQEENDRADREAAPWVLHTHFPWNITEGPLEAKMANLRDVHYAGYYSVEHHKGRDEYSEVAIQLARVRDVFQKWRAAQSG